jgi:hypothetical protein
MTEFPLPFGAPWATASAGLTLSTTGDLWFGISDSPGHEGSVGAITATGELHSFSLLREARGVAVAAAATPNGETFFLAGDNDERLLRVAPDGSQSLMVRAPHQLDDRPGTTPDGGLWLLSQSDKAGTGFGHFKPGAMYRVAPSGKVASFALSGRFEVRSFISGLDGDMWGLTDGFTEPRLRLVSVDSGGRMHTRRAFDRRGRAIPISVSATPRAMWLTVAYTGGHSSRYGMFRITD